MTFSENTNLTPGGQSASPSKVKELENRIDDLQQTVTSVADSVADLADEVTTAELNATSANVTNAVIDNATVGEETVTTANATTVNADNLNATDADITNLTADDVEANSVDADNGYFGSVNAQSFTGQGVNITGDVTASAKVQGKTVQATEKVVTPALESTQTELKGATTVRGDVYFPEDGDKIYGEYLEIDADKVKADIEAETVNATSVTAGTVTGTAIAAQDLLVTGNSRFMGEVQARDIVPEPGQTLDITTDTLDADTLDADTVKVNSLITETPTGSSQLVGYDNNGNLIPVDAGLDPGNYWENVPNPDPDPEVARFIKPKDNKWVQAPAVVAEYIAGMTKIDGVEVVARDLRAVDTLTVEPGCETVLRDTEVDGTLQVNGDIIQNGSAYETHAEKLYTKKDIIITRDGAVSGLSTGEHTGIQAKKYDGTNDGQLVFDNTGEARVGDVGDTEPLLTRDEIANMTDGSLLKWDGTNKKAVCAQSVYIETSWADLKALRDGGHLVKGMQYRITDYVTTTTQPETQSAGHAFDIIVTADSESVLNENARAAIHAGDTYFSDSKLQAWKLKYCLDNDTYRFAWADSTNGKGVIYQMTDEFDNNLPYDFKNIQFKRYKITAKTTAEKPDALVNGYYGARSSQNPTSTSGQLSPSGYTISTSDTVFKFTFDFNGADFSLNKYSNKSGSEWIKNCYGNEIAPYYYQQKQGLNNVVFLNTETGSSNFYNKLTGTNTYSNTFGNFCYSNTFGNSCSFNTFGNSCYSNTFAIPDGIKNFKMDSTFYFDDEDSSNYELQFINNSNSSVTVTGIYFVGEFENKDTQPPTSVNITVPAGTTRAIFYYDDSDYEDSYSYWSLSAMINGRVVNNASEYD